MSEKFTFGRYTLIERLASGELADIYRGTTQHTDCSQRTVVVKCIRPELAADPGFSGQFIDEANLVSVLNHPNIVQVYEWGQHDKLLYIAMEYIEGTNLASMMQSCAEQNLRFSPTLAIYIACEALQGLAYAHTATDNLGHSLNIVHRAINPRSIVLSSEGQVKLVDFGLARSSIRAHSTRPGIFQGKYTYMSPEVVHNKPIDCRADIFSVGVVLYELLTGKKLHGGPADNVSLQMQDLPPSSVYPDIPEELSQTILSTAAEDHTRRPESASVLREELIGFLNRWDKQADANGLSAFLIEVLSGRSAGKKQAGFSFGEATSHWFVEAEEIVRLNGSRPPESLEQEEEENEEPINNLATTNNQKPSFAAGSTMMAVEQGGLGKYRHGSTIAILSAAATVLLLIVGGLFFFDWPTDEDTPPSAHISNQVGFAGAVEFQTSPPGALIWVDGTMVKPVGNPPRVFNVRAGQRRIKLVVPGYSPWEDDVNLAADKTQTITRELSIRHGNLTIRSQPDNALILMNGKRIGHTPHTLPNQAANLEHRFELRARGHQSKKFKVSPADWPEDPKADLILDKKLTRTKKLRRKR